MDNFPNTSMEDLIDLSYPAFTAAPDLDMYGMPTSVSMEPEPLPAIDGLTAGIITQNFGLEQTESDNLDYSNFAKWIPRYSRPSSPCDYCSSRQLQCWFTFENQTSCSACCALFRGCSFTTENHHPVLMDTLHVVPEDVVQSCGELTGSIALRCWDRTPLDRRDLGDDDRPTRRSTGTRFSREAIKLLKNWVEVHVENPYPSEGEKEELATLAGLTVNQVSNWFANTRRRNKRKTARGVSPSIRSSTEGIPIPANKRGVTYNGKTWDIMDPMERWKASPPENEPAALPAIVNAVKNNGISSVSSSLSKSRSKLQLNSSAGSATLSLHRAPSVTSLETGQSDSLQSSESFSNNSLGSSRSHGSRNSLHSFNSGHKKDRRRRKRVIMSTKNQQAESRPYQCTFCTDSFKTKYDWTRHEKSLHLNLEKWICAPLGDVITNPTTGQKMCTFCEEVNPTEEHLETHNHRACEEKGLAARTFYRKDHLRQHLRLVHGCPMIKSMESWKSEPTFIKCRCGFCGESFTSWTERCDHLAKHFRNGAKMKDWQGCRGFDTDVAAFVTNAMPPFLIGNESRTFNPFSASNESTLGLSNYCSGLAAGTSASQQNMEELFNLNQSYADAMLAPIAGFAFNPTEGTNFAFSEPWPTENFLKAESNKPLPKVSTCWEILTIRLGNYVKEQLQQGILPTDEMLQRQARFILYETDDDWNQTAADNREWLELFKKAHGLPSSSTDTRVDFNEDLGVQDLGNQIGELSFDSLTFDTTWDIGATTMEDGELPLLVMS